MAIPPATPHPPAARASVPAVQRRPPNRRREFAVTGPQCHAAIRGRLGQLSTTGSNPACGRCPKVNLAVFLQDTAREPVGSNHLAPAARARPRQHQEQHPGVRGAGDADSDARDEPRVLPAEPSVAHRANRRRAAQRELRGSPGAGPVAERATGRLASGGELLRHLREPGQDPGKRRSPSARPSPRLSQLGPPALADRKSTRLNSSHSQISYAVFCLKKKKKPKTDSSRSANSCVRRARPLSLDLVNASRPGTSRS